MSRRKKWEPNERQLEIYAYIQSGKRYVRAAKKFGLVVSRIHDICKQIDKWLAGRLVHRVEQIKARHYSRLEIIYAEAMAAWRRSQLDEEIETETEKDHGQFPGTETKKTRKGQAGAPAFLAEARAALADQRKIYGADAPDKTETGKPGEFEHGGAGAIPTPEELKKDRDLSWLLNTPANQN